MKNLLFLFIMNLPLLSFAQQSNGKIIYNETVQLSFEIPEEHKQLMGNLPTSQSNKMVLYYTENESLYKNLDKAEDETIESDSEEGNIKVKMVIAAPENLFYKNLNDNKKIDRRDFFGKKFLIEDELESIPWKLTNEQKVILNYPCTKAIFQDSTNNVEAWFTSQIPVSSGPAEYGQLPGMILELNIDEGQTLIVAEKVAFEVPSKDKLKAPKKGKKVSMAEYEKIVEEKTKEMAEEMSGQGGMIRIRN